MIIFNNDQKAYNLLLDFINDNDFSSINILCDKNTKEYCLYILLKELESEIDTINIIEIEVGEKFKTIETCAYIWKNLLKYHCDRKSLLINLGGGVVTDIGGFAASVFKRGIGFINIPTTLLGMVDASIGGKTGVNFNNIKNMIGAFSQPEMTLIDNRYLKTLNNRELKNGFAEMLKHGLIQSKKHWEELINSDYNFINYNLLKDSIEIKKRIVENDPYESGERKLLNFGHSIGHAIEAFFLKDNNENIIRHGEAIVAGMIMESYISVQLGLLKSNDFEFIKDALIQIYGIIEIKPSVFNNIIEFLINDKKNRNKRLYFVLLNDIGKGTFDIEIDKPLVLDALKYYSQLNIN